MLIRRNKEMAKTEKEVAPPKEKKVKKGKKEKGEVKGDGDN